MLITNPFNGIESAGLRPEAGRGGSRSRIHSMELKANLRRRKRKAVISRNPFNGIESITLALPTTTHGVPRIHSMELKDSLTHSLNSSYKIRNPFNGIESMRG